MSNNNIAQPTRVNYFDGQRITESDLDNDQLYFRSLLSKMTLDFHSSGVVQTSQTPNYLFDSSNPGFYGENTTKSVIEAGEYDGRYINLDKQPTDIIYGNRLVFELEGTTARGRESTKILIVGRVFNSLSDTDDVVTEILTIKRAQKVLSANYYNKVYGLILNNFSGGLGKTEFEASKESLNNLKEGGSLKVYESQSLEVYPYLINSQQTSSPNQEVMEFVTSSTSVSIKEEIELALESEVGIDQVFVDFDVKQTISFSKNGNLNIKYGQKFLSNNNNIQGVELLMSVSEDLSQPDPFDWSGDLIFSIYELSTEIDSATARVPENLLDYDPEITPIVQISLDKEDLADRGFELNSNPQIVNIDFSNTNIAVPSSELIKKDKYYAFEVKRTGLNNVGTINLLKGHYVPNRKKELNIPVTPIEEYGVQHYKFYQFDPTTKKYVDDADSSLWFRVSSSAVEVTNGLCYTTDGLFVLNQKTESYVGDTEVFHFERHIDLEFVNGTKQYLVLQQLNNFLDADVHPRTGNFVYTRIQDIPGFKFMSSEDILSLRKEEYPLILASIEDNNPRHPVSLERVFDSAGLYDTNYFYILNPSTDFLQERLIGRQFIPDTNCQCKNIYEIIDVICSDIIYGDLNNDGKIDDQDLERVLDISGNTINSEDTERRLFGGEFSPVEFELSDLNDDETVDGFDIQILEDYIDGKNLIQTPRKLRYLQVYVQNLLPADVYPVVFQDLLGTGTATIATDSIQFTVTKPEEALAVRIGDTINILSGVDQEEYKIYAKQIATDGLTVTVQVTLQESAVEFAGSTGFNVKITSQTKTNIFVDNFDLLKTPYEDKEYLIYQEAGVFTPLNVDICDLRRFVEVSYIDFPDQSCLCDEEGCEIVECDIPSQNEKFLPGNLLLAGNVLDEKGNTHKLDYEYASIKVPMPPGSLTDCRLDIYNNFVKAVGSSCITASGFPAMKYSDGTYVGCEDDGESTDLTKNRIKISGCIASLYVDGFVDGYAGLEETTLPTLADQVLGQTFVDTSYTEFASWVISPFNPPASFGSVSNPSGLNQPATFNFTTANVSGKKEFSLERPASLSDVDSDFVLDFIALRTNWDSSSLGSGQVKFSMKGEVKNYSSSMVLESTATFEVGIRKIGDKQREVYFSGEILSATSALLYDFDFGETLSDDLGDEITFRVKRVGDTIQAFYHISKKIVVELNKFERIGENLDLQLGDGDFSYEYAFSQDNSPVAGNQYTVKLQSFVLREEFNSFAEDSELVLSQNATTREVSRALFNFPLNLSQKTNIIRAEMVLTSLTSGTITDTYFAVPLEVLDLRTIEAFEIYPETTNESLYTDFIPGTIVSGQEITVDISSIIISYLQNTAHLSGYFKGILLEASDGSNSELKISDTITINLVYEEITSGVVFKVGMDIDAKTGIASFKTKNILYDKIIKENRTVIKFGVHMKKAGFANQDVEVTLDQLQNIGLGTCFTAEQLPADNECYFVTGDTANGTFVEGPFPCVLKLNE